MTTKDKRPASPFKEYLRFGATGALNTGTDFLILNLLLASFGPAVEHPSYVAFKIISFTAAVAQSYFLNKHWVFAAQKDGKAADLSEGSRFFAISALGFFINIASSSLSFAALSNAALFDDRLAANVGAMIGTMLVMLWNYAGYKFFVFKQSKNP